MNSNIKIEPLRRQELGVWITPNSLIFFFLKLFTFSVFGQNENIIGYESACKILNKFELNESIVAVIDGGVNTSLSEISNYLWENPNEFLNGHDDDNNGFIDDDLGWNFKNNTNDVSNEGFGDWHGTPVNSIIITLTSSVEYSIIKLLNIVKGDSVSSILKAFEYAYQMRKKYNESNGSEGAFIVAVNCSWGKDSLWASDYPEWCSILDSLGNEGILVVSSVPNSNIDIDRYGDMPSTCSSDFLITVTNTNRKDEKVYEAGYGKKTVDIGAPGENTYTMLNTGEYGYFGGTSAATPYVTAAIGLLFSMPINEFAHDIRLYPDKTASLIKKCILDGSDKIIELEKITSSGGRLNVFSSMKLLCDYYGQQHLYHDIFESLEIISVHPNPAATNTQLLIESDNFEVVMVQLLNIEGSIMKTYNYPLSEGINSLDIGLEDIPKGIYILKIQTEKQIKTTKIIVQ